MNSSTTHSVLSSSFSRFQLISNVVSTGGFRTGRIAVESTLALVVALSFGAECVHAAPLAPPTSTASSFEQSPAKANGLLARRKPGRVASSMLDYPRKAPVQGAKGPAERQDILGTVLVKFRDEMRVRAASIDSPNVVSLSNFSDKVGGVDSLAQFTSILAENHASARQWLALSADKLAAMEDRAATRSGHAQPDLAGFVEICGVDDAELLNVARLLNDLDCVEFVTIPTVPQAAQCADPAAPPCEEAPAGGPPYFEGCIDDTCCQLVSGTVGFEYCSDYAQAPTNTGWDISCAALANMTCNSTPYDFANPDRPTPGPGFVYDPCFYDATNPPDFTLAAFDDVYDFFQFGTCFVAHTDRGCRDAPCCQAICTVDPACCGAGWDVDCANYAISGLIGACPPPPTPVAETPDLTPQETGAGLQGYQFYIQGERRAEANVDVVPGQTWLGATTQGGAIGFDGQGLDLAAFDEFQNLIWQYYQNEIPDTNPFLAGQGIRVGVVDTSAYLSHEDFILSGPAKNPSTFWDGPLLETPRVIGEEGQTMILVNQGAISVDHGTMALGVALAADNGFGVTGIASKAQGYFFPTVSIEEGFRAQNAVASALEFFEVGDILNFPWTAGFGRPISADLGYWTLLRFSSDLGITCLIAAGDDNSQVTVDDGETEDCGATLVGSVLPGNLVQGTLDPSFYPGFTVSERAWSQSSTTNPLSVLRTGLFTSVMSNYTPPENPIEDTSVDCSGWGWAVCTTGTPDGAFGAAIVVGENDVPPGGLPSEADQLRTYTQLFGGTSAASAMMTGVAARVQGFAKQVYGTALAPEQVRGVMGGNVFLQHPCSGQTGEAASQGPDTCRGGPCGDPVPCDEWNRHEVVGFPNMTNLVVSVLSGNFFDGNEIGIRVITGLRVAGYSFSPFLVRALDNNYLRMQTERGRAGQVEEGLTYLATGGTTDVLVDLLPNIQLPETTVNSLGIGYVSRATRNFVFAGAFVRNWEMNRYEFIGAELLTTLPAPYGYDLPIVGDYNPYLNSATGKVQMRLWTCSLGVARSFEVWHDLIEIRVNDPLIPVP